MRGVAQRSGDWWITQDEYDKKARELKERQAEIATRIDQHQDGDDTFRTTPEALISLASRAAELFERSNIDEKRQLLAFVFSNLNLRGKRLEFSMRSPFDLMVGREDYPSWLGDLDAAPSRRDPRTSGRCVLDDGALWMTCGALARRAVHGGRAAAAVIGSSLN